MYVILHLYIYHNYIFIFCKYVHMENMIESVLFVDWHKRRYLKNFTAAKMRYYCVECRYISLNDIKFIQILLYFVVQGIREASNTQYHVIQKHIILNDIDGKVLWALLLTLCILIRFHINDIKHPHPTLALSFPYSVLSTCWRDVWLAQRSSIVPTFVEVYGKQFNSVKNFGYRGNLWRSVHVM